MKKISSSLLTSLGLSPAEADVYVAVLELGEANLQEIADKSGVKRTTIYHFLPELKTRGFLIETKKRKRKVYSATHPEQLLEIEKTRLAELERLMPELLAIQNQSQTKPKVTFYEGVDGIKEVYADMLKDKKHIIAFEDLEHMKEGLPSSFYDFFPSERAKRNITFHSIARDSEIAREFVKSNIKLLRQTKLLRTADWKTEINIYGSKVALMSFRTDPPFCVLIEDPSIADTLKTAWKELWQRLDCPVIG